MADLSRIGIAIDADLLAEFDHLIDERGYGSRSEAFRDMIRDALINQAAAADDTPVVGTITLVYDHHQRLLSDRLTAAQHEFHHAMLSTLHVHLDHDNCLEVVVVRGPAGEVRRVADLLIAMKGVKHGRLTLTSARPAAPRTARRHRHGRRGAH
jgi:CopG family transcriptional regulator, nickel-responsive regulator